MMEALWWNVTAVLLPPRPDRRLCQWGSTVKGSTFHRVTVHTKEELQSKLKLNADLISIFNGKYIN